MSSTRMSSKGQVIIPKPVRTALHWEAGQELIVVDVGDGVLLKPKTPFPPSDIESVASCLKFKGKARTLKDMEAAITRGVRERQK